MRINSLEISCEVIKSIKQKYECVRFFTISSYTTHNFARFCLSSFATIFSLIPFFELRDDEGFLLLADFIFYSVF